MQETISIIIVTRNRTQLLQQAIQSVVSQDYDGLIEVIVCLDNCKHKSTLVSTYKNNVFQNRIINIRDNKIDENIDVSERLAKIRNGAVLISTGSLIGFLDDDNQFMANHVSSLVSSLQKFPHAVASHSWRRLIDSEGLPWFADRFPWSGPDKQFDDFEYYCSQGVLHPGSDILRDRVQLRNGKIGMVDTSCWLFRRDTIIKFPFPEKRQPQDIKENKTEDDLLLANLFHAQLPIISTYFPTVFYRLGGYSNA